MIFRGAVVRGRHRLWAFGDGKPPWRASTPASVFIAEKTEDVLFFRKRSAGILHSQRFHVGFLQPRTGL
jgi:hypothetical protein